MHSVFKIVTVIAMTSFAVAADSIPCFQLDYLSETPLPGGGFDVKIVGDLMYVANGAAGLQILDITDPINPTIIGSFATNGVSYALQVEGDLAYLADGEKSGMYIIDVSHPELPTQVGFYATSRSARDVFVLDGIAFIADYTDGIDIVDVSEPANPVFLSNFETTSAYKVFVSNDIAYIADGSSGVMIFDVSDLSNPSHITTFNTDGSAFDIIVRDEQAYIADNSNGLVILDVSIPMSPALVSTFDQHDRMRAIDIAGTTLYATDLSNTSFRMQSIDIEDTAQPQLISTYPILDNGLGIGVTDSVVAIAIARTRPGNLSGIQLIDVSSPGGSPVLSEFDTGNALDIEVVGSLAYVADSGNGLNILDVSDPSNPVLLDTANTLDQARGISVDGVFAYVASRIQGIYTMYVGDPSDILTYPAFLTPGLAYDIHVVDGIAYVADGFDFAIYDVRNPFTPLLIDEHRIGDSATVFSVQVQGTLAYVSAGEYGLAIVDISDPSDPVNLGRFDTPSLARHTVVVDNIAYVADLNDGLFIVDVSDPNNLVLITELRSVGGIEGVDVVDDIAYLALQSDGIEMIDVSDPTAPVSIGSYDTRGSARRIDVIGTTAYLADGNTGMVIMDVSTECSNCVVDLTGDGAVNFFDVSAFLLAFSAQESIADFTGDEHWNFFDVSAFLLAYSEGCP